MQEVPKDLLLQALLLTCSNFWTSILLMSRFSFFFFLKKYILQHNILFIQVFVANPHKPREVKLILAKNQEKLLELLHNLSPGKGCNTFSNSLLWSLWLHNVFLNFYSAYEHLNKQFLLHVISICSVTFFRFRRWAIWGGKRVYHQGNCKAIMLSYISYSSCVWFCNKSFVTCISSKANLM